MGAGDVDFSFSCRHAQSAVAPGTVIIAVSLILILIIFFVKVLAPGLTYLEKFSVFLLPLCKVF